jgi:hypothetical protein
MMTVLYSIDDGRHFWESDGLVAICRQNADA